MGWRRSRTGSGPLYIPGRGGRATTHWLVRFGYDGRGFAGWARQPGERTVEGEIDRGIARFRAPISRAPFRVASRTDRGVSAVGNALVVDSELSGPALLRSLNGVAPELFFTRATEVAESFRVRHADRRVYRYFEPSPATELDRWRKATGVIPSQIDVRSFGRAIPPSHPQWRPIEAVTVEAAGPGLVLEFRAPSFVWGMVRKLMAALRAVASDRLALAEFESALAGRRRLMLPMAEPEPLILWDVDFPVEWTHQWRGVTRYQAAWWSAARAEVQSRARVVDALASVAVPDPS